MQVKTKNLMFGALVVLLVGVLWYRVAYSSMESKASKAKSAAHDATVSADNLRGAIGGSTSPKKTKNKDVPTDVMLGAIPAGSSEAAFLRSIDALRVSSGADWQSITPVAPVAAGSVGSINVGIDVQGSEQALAAYANGLEELQRIFVIDNMSITGAPANNSTGGLVQGGQGAVFEGGQLQLQISGRIFTQPGGVTGTATASGGVTPPVTSAPATGGATAPSGVQNN